MSRPRATGSRSESPLPFVIVLQAWFIYFTPNLTKISQNSQYKLNFERPLTNAKYHPIRERPAVSFTVGLPFVAISAYLYPTLINESLLLSTHGYIRTIR